MLIPYFQYLIIFQSSAAANYVICFVLLLSVIDY